MSAVLPRSTVATPWRQALPTLGLALAALLLLYRDTFAAMVGIWSRSDTFAHAFLVPPIALWLVWRRRDDLRPLVPRAQPWVLVPMALVAAGWLVGDLAGVNALTQLAATALLVLAVPALLGLGVARALTFPLCFLFFMVPIGEFVMPTLMQWTAAVTVFALKAFGLPVYQEGLQFVIPSGTWSVVEACSGVRYLIASFMVGTLFAYLNYRSARRRVVFGIVSLLVPVAANWGRAVMIVMLGHLSGNKLAAGVDHIIYGWVFFGIVIGLMFFIGGRWAEAPAPPRSPASAPGSAAMASRPALTWSVAVGLVVLLGVAPAVAWRLESVTSTAPQLLLPALTGVALGDARPLHTPVFEGTTARISGVYGAGPEAVTVDVAYYRHQTYGHKLVNSENVLVTSKDKVWHRTAQGTTDLVVAGRSVPVRTAELRSGDLAGAGAAQRLQVRQVYWVGGRLTSDDHAAVLLALLGQISGRGDDAAAITFYIAGDDPLGAGKALDGFVATHLDALASWLDQVRMAR